MKATSALRRLAAVAATALLSLAACKSAPDAAATTPVGSSEAAPTCQAAPATDGVAAAPTQPAGQCVPEAPPLAEVPTTFDCTQPAPLVACCKALLPRCEACVDRNRDIDAAWRAACKPDEAAPSAPATVPPVNTP
jgi:hypothetical protein